MDKKPKTIKSLKSYINAILDLRSNMIKAGETSGQWFFRGQKCDEWNIIPNIFRNGALASEYTTIAEAIRLRPLDFKEYITEFDILVKLQHYGLGTRLLDVTLNPLVALYFATEEFESYIPGKDGRGKNVSKDGQVFYQYTYTQSVNELNTRIACALPFINFEAGFTLENLLNALKVKKIISNDELNLLLQNDYEHLIAAIQQNHFVVTSYSNDRLIRQSGAFLIPAAIKIIDDLETNAKIATKAFCVLDEEFSQYSFIIPHEFKQQIREELDFFNINESTLFPELEHQMSYIQHCKSCTNISVEPYVRYLRPEQPDTKRDMQIAVVESPTPDIEKIIDSYISNCSKSVKAEIKRFLSSSIEITDWFNKESIQSKIRLDLSKILAEQYSAIDRKRIANEILNAMLNSSSEFSASEE